MCFVYKYTSNSWFIHLSISFLYSQSTIQKKEGNTKHNQKASDINQSIPTYLKQIITSTQTSNILITTPFTNNTETRTHKHVNKSTFKFRQMTDISEKHGKRFKNKVQHTEQTKK